MPDLEEEVDGPDVPDLSGNPDNEPEEGVEEPAVDTHDPEGTEVPEQNKHAEEEE
jgi:hypothetical protein